MVENSDKATQGIRWRRVKEGCQARGRSGCQNFHICSGFQNTSNSIFSGFQNDSNFDVFSLSLFPENDRQTEVNGPKQRSSPGLPYFHANLSFDPDLRNSSNFKKSLTIIRFEPLYCDSR